MSIQSDYCAAAPANLLGSHYLKDKTGICDRSTEGYLFHPRSGRKFPTSVKGRRGFVQLWVRNPDWEKAIFALAKEPDPFADIEPPPQPDNPDDDQYICPDAAWREHVTFAHSGVLKGHKCEVCIQGKMTAKPHTRQDKKLTREEVMKHQDEASKAEGGKPSHILVQLDGLGGPLRPSKHYSRRWAFLAADVTSGSKVGLCTTTQHD